jgi:hypothetical protein
MAEDANAKPSPSEQVSRLYEQVEAQSAHAAEELVGGAGFATLLGRLAENTAAVTKLSGDAIDIVLRNLRLAGRRDIVSLARQLARTEDKLERVLQEVEALRDELTRTAPRTTDDGRPGDAQRPRRNGRAGRTTAKTPANAPAKAPAKAAAKRSKESG